MGCMVNLKTLKENFYTAVAHVTPFYDVREGSKMAVAKPLVKTFYWFNRVGYTPEVTVDETDYPHYQTPIVYDFKSNF